MKKKIFVSYKYGDNDVKKLTMDPLNIDTVRSYVDLLERIIGEDNIYKGEHDGEDLSNFKDETIWTKLKDKIFDSSITIVLISKNMKDPYIKESEQWIPQEISYSLKEITRNDGARKSKSNAMICVIIPDRYGSYDYYIRRENIIFPYNTDITFEIIKGNMNNGVESILKSYIVTTTWDNFIISPEHFIKEALDKQDDIDSYKIKKEV